LATIVKAKRDESTDSVTRRFKRRALIDDTLTRVREKEFYKKPALLRKEKKKELERRRFRDQHIRADATKTKS
jgi:ribosomal protein S21